MTGKIKSVKRGAVACPAREGKPDAPVVRRSLFRLLTAWGKAASVPEAQDFRVAVEALLKVAEQVEALADNGRVDTWSIFMSRYYRLVDKWDRDVELSCFGGPSQGEKCAACPASRACLYEHRKGRTT